MAKQGNITRQYLLRKIKASVSEIDRCFYHLDVLEKAYKKRYPHKSLILLDIQIRLYNICIDLISFHDDM